VSGVAARHVRMWMRMPRLATHTSAHCWHVVNPASASSSSVKRTSLCTSRRCRARAAGAGKVNWQHRHGRSSGCDPRQLSLWRLRP
jgi:hypothetical protein